MSEEASGLKSDRKKVFKNAALVASGTMTSRILGLFRDMALAALFDRTLTDAWTAAFRIPNLFRRLLGEGSLSVSFIPVFMEAEAADLTGTRSRNLINSFYSLLLVTLATITLAGILGAEGILRMLLDSSFLAVPGKLELTVRLAKIMFGFVFFVSTYAYFMGILNALGSFALPALAPTLFNVSMLIFTFLPGSWFAQAGDGLAWGVLLGGFLQALVLFIALNMRGYLPSLSMKLWSHDVRAVVIGMIPGLLGLGLAQFTTLVNLHFASRLMEGSVSYIYWADRLLELPLSLVAVSLGSALLPKLAELSLSGRSRIFQETLWDGFFFAVFLILPASVGLFMLAGPIVEVLFYRGAFNQTDLTNTTLVLQVYSLSMVFVAAGRVISSAFYAQRKNLLPGVSAVFSLLVHILLAPIMMRQFELGGLVLSSLVSHLLHFGILSASMSLQIEPDLYIALAKRLAKMIFVTSLMGLFLWGWSLLRGEMPLFLFVAVGIAVAGGIYLGISQLLRVKELTGVIGTFSKKS